MRARNRKLHSLILTDWAIKDTTLVDISHCCFGKPTCIANRFSRHQNTLGIHAIKNIFKAFAFFTNQVVSRYLQIIKKDFGGVMIDHCLQWANLKPFAQAIANI